LDDFGVDCKWPYYLDTGILRQGTECLHQDLHLDNYTTDIDGVTERIWREEEVSAEDWLKCGYVIDMPLSEEGSWLRVAVPDPGNTTFVINWVFIPYGSFLVRSTALFHGGHYGSPGSVRLHAIFSVKEGAVMGETRKLAYHHSLASKIQGFENWKLSWNNTVDESCRGPDGYKHYKTKRVAVYKGYGTSYYNNAVLPQTYGCYGAILRNLSPYKRDAVGKGVS
jgi:hypothetical protein